MQAISKNADRLISLWDIMNTFEAFKLARFTKDIEKLRSQCREGEDTQNKNTGLANYPAQKYAIKPTVEFVEHIVAFLRDTIVSLCSEIGLTHSMTKIMLILHHLRVEENPLIDMSSLDADLRNVEDVIIAESMDIKFVRVDLNLSGYIDNESLFGEPVKKSFPSAVEDIKNAGNCLAVELPTAAVFHLMRVSEHGLRRLARKLQVKVIDKKQLCPLEYAEWDKVITAIDNKIKAMKPSLPKGPKRQTQLELYSEANQHCLFMKDIWRNTISHTRKPYSSLEAQSVFERVRDFMQFLDRALRVKQK